MLFTFSLNVFNLLYLSSTYQLMVSCVMAGLSILGTATLCGLSVVATAIACIAAIVASATALAIASMTIMCSPCHYTSYFLCLPT